MFSLKHNSTNISEILNTLIWNPNLTLQFKSRSWTFLMILLSFKSFLRIQRNVFIVWKYLWYQIYCLLFWVWCSQMYGELFPNLSQVLEWMLMIKTMFSCSLILLLKNKIFMHILIFFYCLKQRRLRICTTVKKIQHFAIQIYGGYTQV